MRAPALIFVDHDTISFWPPHLRHEVLTRLSKNGVPAVEMDANPRPRIPLTGSFWNSADILVMAPKAWAGTVRPAMVTASTALTPLTAPRPSRRGIRTLSGASLV